MASGVYKGLTIELNAKTTALSTALRQSEREARSLQREMNQVQKSMQFDGSNTSAFNRQMQLLEKSIESATKKLENLKQAESKYGKDGMSTDAWTKLQYEIGKAEGDIERYREQMRQLVTEQAAANSALGEAGAKLSEWGDKLDPIGQKMQSAGRTLTTHVTVPLVAAGTASVKAAVDIDTALTGVKKTVDGTAEQYEELKQAAIEFSKTNAVSAEQVLNAQALGAQLGFTIDELDEFSRVATGMEIATDMGLEDAASEMAQFANITQMSHDQISNYASAIVNVGNNMATTESKVSSMAQRIAAAGTQVKMSQADIIGWSGVMSSLGIEAEAGGTAFSQFVSSIDAAVATGSDDLQAFASIAGMSAEEFSQAWQDSSTDALQAILRGVAGADNMTVALESMGVTGVRQSDVLKRLAGNTDLVARGLQIANKGWQENTALSNEVANRNDSLASKFEMLKNRVIAVAEEVGKPLADAMLSAIDAAEPLFEAIESGARAFSDMSEDEQKAVVQTVAIIAALGPALSLFGKAASSVSVLGGAMTTLSKYVTSVQLAFGKLPAGVSPGAASVAQMSSKMKLATAAAGGLQAAAVALAVAGIAVCAKAIADTVEDISNFEKSTRGLEEASRSVETAMKSTAAGSESASSGLYKYGDAVREVSDRQAKLADEMTRTFSDVNADAALVQDYVDQIVSMQDGFDGSAESVAALQAAIDGYNSITGESLEITDKTTGALSKTRDELQRNAEAWAANARAQAAQEMYQESYKNQLEIKMQLASANDRLAQAQAHYNEVQGMTPELVADASEELRAAQAEVDALSQQYDSAEKSSNNLMEATKAEKQALEDASKASTSFRSALEKAGRKGDEFDSLAKKLGKDVDSFASELEAAGIDSRTFASVGASSFDTLYSRANGDLTKVVQDIGWLNRTGIDPKTLKVDDNGTIRDVRGRVIDLDNYTINGKKFIVDEIDYATADIQRIIDERIPDKTFAVRLNDLATSALNRIKDTFNGTNVWFNALFNGNAAGGLTDSPIKMWAHADGGVGGIVTSPTLTNVGLVGEAGAEAVLGNAIIPLTNRRYTDPFAEAIASHINGTESAELVIAWLDANMPEIISRYTPVMGERDFDRAVRRTK